MKEANINKLLREYVKERNSEFHRYASFDYCYGYFNSFKDKKLIASEEYLEKSCLHLGFFLASWGMYRGSSFILQKNLNYLLKYIEVFSKSPDKLWRIDIPDYGEDTIKCLRDKYKEFRKLIPPGHQHLTLITKIMLGVYGCVPAFDTNFRKGMQKLHRNNDCKFSTFSKKSLECLKEFYETNSVMISRQRKKIKVLRFDGTKQDDLYYPIAKIIDMIGFQMGLQSNIKQQSSDREL